MRLRCRRRPMILNGLVEKLKRRSKDDFKGRHFEATLILQAVSWYLRYPLSYRDIEELFLERGLEVDHATLNRWVLAYAPLIEKSLRAFRKPHCGSVRIDEDEREHANLWGVIMPLLLLPCGHHSRAGSLDSVDGRRLRVCRSARPCARRGRAARSPGSSASAAPCSCAWPRSR